ncbi:septal ring lytic transglycosylase RlpA family protein [Vibrio cincinnatiensis]|uniref:Endolytic peptidoglycan transglycosylase RlpA n=1 Tax=Vibrio cincinnatiensis DSM 19608 TaxID=1123491 RepID=A0A1T4PKS3_VIBCI|nr:septal ring lytic transglycosylase RlpA family protein [Vibrio cincinnatiensis]MCG3722493.1 septal ring lytic transglycosylase RlpA family protein [Vibrio cincinnatiensis]MCG3731859.1 septal ring lytic transglycosylase RlpA family protein [Vibrio cincinnatiensis]MCG3736958.1 septal ring lytic transglycosylase RlpA family protein [Vibrio cincinnatiensis]MCG3739555.1 septal ring lytic transglycosylase RlpA family protein [Vibrio cincinnatiensis]MCG3742072.1 septal ring lytic transglycosylase 
MKSLSLYFSLGTFVLLVGCSSPQPTGRYSMDDDVAPSTPLSVAHIEDATPQYEPYSLGGNRDYTLRGQHYQIIRDAQGFVEKGQASWYGKKFHGHLTSNGEIYDMYSMTAAHKTLPLPSYVKVTNLDNAKTAIVRVNDRGPFHEGRVIDLSYAAAYKLGVVQSGTANVEIAVITPPKPTLAPLNAQPIHYIIQVAASQHEQRVRTLAEEIGQNLTVPSFVDNENQHYRILLGPFTDYSLTQETLERVKSLGYQTAFIRKNLAK